MEVLAISATVIAALKKILLQAMIDEESRKRLITVLVSILTAFFVIFLTIASLPTILINTFASNLFPDVNIPFVMEEDVDVIEDKEKVAIYQDTIILIDQQNKQWIEETKAKNTDCNEFEVIYNYDLTWESLIAIDAVLLKQDFKKMNPKKIEQIGIQFLTREIRTIEKEVEEEYEVEETYEVIVSKNGVSTTETRTRTVTETRTVIKKVGIITIDTRDFEDVLPEVNIVEEEDVVLATNIYQTISFIDIEGNLQIYDNRIDFSNLEEYPEGYANLPYYNQGDKRWGAYAYGKSTILEGGCGPTSLAMVVAGLTENKVTPLDVANWSYENGHRAEGAGSYWSLMTDGGRYFGLNVQSVSRKDPNSVIKALSEGHPIIVSMGKGHFTNGGHFIVLRGITADGKILVHDSASVKRSNQEWDLSVIMNESSKNGGVNGRPFWIFKN